MFISGSSNVSVTNNDLSLGTGFNGISVSTASGAPSSAITITGNTLDGFENAINVGGLAALSDALTIHGNKIGDNSSAGVNAPSNTSTLVNATGNWWGDVTGPNDPTSGDGSTPDTNAGVGTGANGAVNYGGWCTAADCSTTFVPGPNAPEVITDAASNITASEATLNGTNGNNAATQESFWVSTGPIVTTSPNIPAGVYSTPVLPAAAANTPLSDQLSLVTTNGITTGGLNANMPAITPGTTYNYVAWSLVDGTWYPGQVLQVTTSAPATPPVVTVTPVADSLLHGIETFTITVTGSDVDPAKNNKIWVYLYNSGGTQKHQGQSVDLSSGTGTFTVDTTKLDDGDTWLDVGDLYGADGNLVPGGDNYFKDYIIDNTAPTVTITPLSTAGNLSGSVTFDITINDAHPAAPKNNKVWVYLYNTSAPQASQGANVDLSSGTGTFTVDTTKLANGGAELDVGQIYDAAGNVNGPVDNYFPGYTVSNVVVPPPATPSVTTDADTNPTANDATLNGTNGPVDATGSSFWVSTSSFTVTSSASPTLPSGVYSTLNL